MGFRLFDQYTLLHAASGVIAYFLGLSFTHWFIIHALFEYVENTAHGVKFINRHLTFWPGGKPEPDAPINQLGDQVGALIGWLVAAVLDHYGKKFNWYLPVSKNIYTTK